MKLRHIELPPRKPVVTVPIRRTQEQILEDILKELKELNRNLDPIARRYR